MDVKEAVKAAKIYVGDVFGEEGVYNVGLEEVEYDQNCEVWRVTIGFSRPWNTVRTPFTLVTGDSAPRRSYKVVAVNENGDILSVKQRDKSE